MGQKGNNYDFSNKFQEICLEEIWFVLAEKDFSNQRISISKKKFPLIHMMFFWTVFSKTNALVLI
jgi:hypothetical protein